MSKGSLQKIVIFGKGGIGKSTVTANLAVVYALQGKRVLVVGCDPKHDTTVVLTGGRMIPTVVGSSGFTDGRTTPDSIVVRGRLGIDCVEAGGPEPGVGCAGRGISRMAEILEANGTLDPSRYDVVLFDVLGDVVCGGFAAPLRQGFARKVVIVTSEELMSLYAANNIARAVKTYLSNGIALLGLVANLRGCESEPAVMSDFARMIDTRVLTHLSRESKLFRDAERLALTVTEAAPKSETARKFQALARLLLILKPDQAPEPAPLSDEEFYTLSREDFSGERATVAPQILSSRPQATPAAFDPAVPAPQHPPTEEGPGFEGLRAHASQVLQGSQALQWGDAERWRQFFADREFARNRDAGMRFSGPVYWVHHGDIECRYSTPSFDEGLVSFLNLPCVSFPGERVRGESRGEYGETDLKEADIIGGGLGNLDAVLKAAEGGGCEIVVVNATCVPVLIGDDWRMVVEKSRRRSGLEIHYNAPSAGRELNIVKVFFDRLKSDPVFSQTKPQAGVINLVGFPDTLARRELEVLLGKAGVEVNLAILPYLDYEQARRFGRASVQVLYPSCAYARLYESLLSGSASRSVSPPAPYGLAGTRRWLREVCEAAGVGAERAESAFDEAWSSIGSEWRRLRDQARGQRLAFVLDAEHLRRLLDEGGVRGVPMLGTLREAGFGLDFLLYSPPGARPGSAKDDARIQRFSTPAELDLILKKSDLRAVYSEFFFDERLASAGKAQFSLAFFSMGVQGSLRGLQRLTELCRWRFYRRYADYLGGEDAF